MTDCMFLSFFFTHTSSPILLVPPFCMIIINLSLVKNSSLIRIKVASGWWAKYHSKKRLTSRLPFQQSFYLFLRPKSGWEKFQAAPRAIWKFFEEDEEPGAKKWGKILFFFWVCWAGIALYRDLLSFPHLHILIQFMQIHTNEHNRLMFIQNSD